MVSGGAAGACAGRAGGEAGLKYNITISANIIKIADMVVEQGLTSYGFTDIISFTK